jgi:thiol-disulfide isomerase/thioredoxin
MKPMVFRKNRAAAAGLVLILALFLGLVVPACAPGPVVGRPAPDVTLNVPGGRPLRLSDYRGKPVVLHFWASWCGPCVAELPLIAELGARNSAELTVLAVNCAETEAAVSAFLAAGKLSLNVVMDRDLGVSNAYQVNAIPQTFMIDSRGIIRSVQVGAYTGEKLGRDLAALLKHGAGA